MVRFILRIFSRHIPPKTVLLTVLLVLFAPISLLAATEDISVDVRTFVDPSRNLTIDQVLALEVNRFEPARRADLNFGYTRNAIWLRIAITSVTNRVAVLSLGPNFVDLIDIHVVKAGSGNLWHIRTGDHRPIPPDGMSGLDDAVELALQAHETQLIYVRLAAVNNALTTEVRVYPKAKMAWRNTVSILLAGLGLVAWQFLASSSWCSSITIAKRAICYWRFPPGWSP